MAKKKKSKKAPLRGNRYGYGQGLSASDQRRQKKAFKKNVKKYKKGDKSAFEPTAVDKEVMADREAGRRPEAPESKYNDSMETPKLKVSILSEGEDHPHFDPVNGLGAVPFNQDIHRGRKGFVKHMKPSEFLDKAANVPTPRESLNYITSHMKSGGKVGNPTLWVQWNKHSNSWDTHSHEGRHRMMAYKAVHGDKPVPVHIGTRRDEDGNFEKRGNKSWHISDEMTKAPIGRETHTESMETPKLKVSILNEDWKKAIAKKAKASGKPASILRKVYKRGLAAYASGHRPGMSQHAWAMARVNSYLRGGPARKVDSDIKEGVEHGTQFKMVHVGSDQEGRKTYKLHAHCEHDGHAGHVKFSMHKGHTYIHAMEIKDSLKRQGYGPAMMHEIHRMHDENPDQHGKIHYAGHHEDNAQMPMPEALNIEDIPVAGGDLARIQQGKKPLRGIKAKIVDMGQAVKKGVKKVMKVIRGDVDESVEKSGERFSGYNKPKRTPGKNKKFAVLAKEGAKVRIIRFGDPNMKIKKHTKGRRKNFRARHGCDKGKLSKLTARYWSCRKW